MRIASYISLRLMDGNTAALRRICLYRRSNCTRCAAGCMLNRLNQCVVGVALEVIQWAKHCANGRIVLKRSDFEVLCVAPVASMLVI
jgi:hypothetical protein